MNKEEIKELQERAYDIAWSGLPLDTFFNDIRDNPNPNFNKNNAYEDFKKIVDEIYKLKDKAKKYDELEKTKIKKKVQKVVRTYPESYITPTETLDEFLFNGFKIVMCNPIMNSLEYIIEKEIEVEDE